MYLVIETCDRQTSDIKPAKDLRSAAETANKLLKAHCANLNKDDVYEAYSGPVKPSKWPPDIQLADPGDAEMSAWSNLSNLDYDANVLGVDPVTACDMLDILLKELCKAEMDKPDSGCSDGACEDCPITRALEMAEAKRAALAPADQADGQEGGYDAQTD